MINKIYNEDCLVGMKRMQDKSVDLIVTDPPYLINYKTNHRKDKNHIFCKAICSDNDRKLIKEYIKECFRVLKENKAIYIFCSSKTIDFFKQECEKNGFKIKNIIVWEKNNWTAGDLQAQYGQQYEFIILANKGRARINGKRLSDIWKFDRVVGKEQLHQNQKPIKLIKQCIEKHSNEGDLVFDGFMGSGTTALAALQSNRQFLGFEIDSNYYEIAINRIKKERSSRY